MAYRYVLVLNNLRPIDQKEGRRKMKKKYEVMYIIRPTVESDDVKAIIESLTTFLLLTILMY